MPQTVWDYVAKLKTSVTKASNRYNISFCVLINNIENLSIFYILFCLFLGY